MTPRGVGIPCRKRLAHRAKAVLYRQRRLDAALDAWLEEPLIGLRRRLRESAYLRLLPERRVRVSPFAAAPGAAPRAGEVLVLSLVPPEDTGGGSRPAQLAAELHGRGAAITWRWALPIFPWPRLRRPGSAGLDVAHVRDGEAAARGRAFDLVLLEAPHPDLVASLRALGGDAAVIYDAIDVWDGALGAGWYERAAEDEAIDRARHLVASSKLLRDELAARSGRTVALLPNAVDRRRFDPSIARAAPPDVRRGTPTVAYVGALWGGWVDLDLVARLANALPRAAIHLIGPAGDRRLPAARNLFALGAKPQDEIAAYLQAADVTIVPFAPSRLAAAVSPLKVFEALAMRRPVVSTPLPELEGVPGVHLAATPEEFCRLVAAAPGLPWPERAAEAFVAHHTWAARVDDLLRLAGVSLAPARDAPQRGTPADPAGALAERKR